MSQRNVLVQLHCFSVNRARVGHARNRRARSLPRVNSVLTKEKATL
jgi:hypothetical protein